MDTKLGKGKMSHENGLIHVTEREGGKRMMEQSIEG